MPRPAPVHGASPEVATYPRCIVTSHIAGPPPCVRDGASVGVPVKVTHLATVAPPPASLPSPRAAVYKVEYSFAAIISVWFVLIADIGV
ncbi:hypothetical protein ZWY2020_045476 [Hordeum vulgare]|nr:hypothetical protein ZWY2020_045476 [Hordeum vulgare]